MPYLLKIIEEGHPILRKVAKRVRPDEIRHPAFQRLIDDMFLTMYQAPGIGLAAPQVNVSKRLFTIDLQDGNRDHGPFAVINPEFELTEGEVVSADACLSVPGYAGESKRHAYVVVTGLDRHGKKIRLEGGGLFAVCLQHEIDHLNGVLYKDKAQNVRKVGEPVEVAEAE